MNDWLNRCHFGDVRAVLRKMIADGVQVHTIVTSPPYWGLRSYLPADHPDKAHEIGSEPTIGEFIATMVEVFDLCRQVLRDDGTLWCNMGDSYAAGGSSKPSLPISDVDAAWLAALIDGEGCIQIHRQQREGSVPSFQADVSVGQIDAGMVQRAATITKLGAVNVREGRVWDWSVRGQEAALLLRRVYPFLVLKRNQAAAAIEVARHIKDNAFHRVKPATPEAIQYREALRATVAASNQRKPDGMVVPEPESAGLKPKDLIGQPWRLAFALQDAGWWLRQDIIWAKPNPMPESIRDRCTKAHEYMFLLAKSERYYFDQDAIRTPLSPETKAQSFDTMDYKARDLYKMPDGWNTGPGAHGSFHPEGREKGRSARDSFKRENSKRAQAIPGQTVGTHRPDREESSYRLDSANKRSVWTVATEAYPGSHFATFPRALIEPCVLAGAPAGGIVLDPFFGSGTTGQVAQALGRNFIGIDLNEANKPLQDERLRQPSLIFEEPLHDEAERDVA